MFENRTDLALEERESFEGNGGEIGGVALREWRCHGSSIRMTEVSILNEKGAESMGKPMGTYLTMEDPGLSETEDAYCEAAAGELGRQLASLIRKNCASTMAGLSILVAGRGNRQVTPDSLGPRVVDGLSMNRHLRTEPGRRNGTYLYTAEKAGRTVHPVLSGIHPGVMAQTGMETAEIVRGVVRESRPDLVIAVDALAARNVHRLASTIQLTDTGIHPGSGVGNHRRGMTRENLGVPVIAIGVPTVVGAAAIVHGTVNALVRTLTASKEGSRYGEYIRELDSDSQYELIRELLEPEFGAMFVTPQDMDERICKLSAAIAEGIRRAVERLEEER